MIVEDVIIIGAGPAGLAAALQLKRYGYKMKIFESSQVGGLLWNAYIMENYPGFPNGIPGPELAQIFSKHVKSFGIEITKERVVGISWKDDLFHVKTSSGVYISRTAVIASGTKSRMLTQIDIPADLRDKVIYEIKSILHIEGKQIIIVGAGDAAFDYALSLSECNFVTILNRSEKLKCLPLLWNRAISRPNITYLANTTLSILSGTAKNGITAECINSAGTLTLHADYIVGAIGRDPQIDFLTKSFLQQSSVLEKRSILYYIGDVKNGLFRQTAISVGNGISAAMSIYQILRKNID